MQYVGKSTFTLPSPGFFDTSQPALGGGGRGVHQVYQPLYFNREASQGSTYFLGKYYSREHLNVKIPNAKLYQEYLILEGSAYLLLNKYWGSSYVPANNYWGVLFSEEYLLIVTPVRDSRQGKQFLTRLYLYISSNEAG